MRRARPIAKQGRLSPPLASAVLIVVEEDSRSIAKRYGAVAVAYYKRGAEGLEQVFLETFETSAAAWQRALTDAVQNGCSVRSTRTH